MITTALVPGRTAPVELLVTPEGELALPWADPIVAGACVTHAGELGPPRVVQPA